MQLKVISEEFEEGTSTLQLPIVVIRIKVLVDDELLHAESGHHPETIRNIPSEVLIGALRSKIMVAIEQKLFNDFNPRVVH